MKKFYLLVLYCLLISLSSRQQTADSSLPRRDTARLSPLDSLNKMRTDSLARVVADSLAQETARIQIRSRLESFQSVLRSHPVLPFDEEPVPSNIFARSDAQNESLFYFLVGILFYFACIKLFFSKYLDNLTTLFFRATMRQQQVREQLLQTPLPSLLLNILFVISSGLYLALLARYYEFDRFGSFWATVLYATGFVSAIYAGKFMVLHMASWIFNIRSATGTYIFIVFLVNKMIGIFLLPFVVFMAFPNKVLLPVLVSLSYVMLLALFGYRFLNSFRPIRNEIKVNRFHFFIYLCAFEIAPLLLIYKVLLAFVERST